MSTATETCACGASITVDVRDGLTLGFRLDEWRKEHQHDLDAADACRERDEAMADRDRIGAMVEWLAEVIVDAREACDRTESIQPQGSPDWVESGIAMRKTVLYEVRKVLNRERTAHPSALDRVTAERDEAIRHKVEMDDLRRQAEAERDEANRRNRLTIERNAEILAENERLTAAVARVRALHTSVPLTDPCDHEDRDACDAVETSDGEWVCGPVVAHACAVCRDESGELVDYPCATITALNTTGDITRCVNRDEVEVIEP